MNIEAFESIEGEVEFTNPVVGSMDLAIESHEQGNRMLGYRVWRIGRYPYDLESKVLCHLQVDVVEACTSQSDQSDSLFCKQGQTVFIQFVVYKYTDAVCSRSCGGSLSIEAAFLQLKFGAMDKVLPVVGLGVVETAGKHVGSGLGSHFIRKIK